MSVVVDDPLIAAMDIRQTLPLHESSRRLRELCPHSPRDHGVAVLADVSRRRWWPLESAITTDRLEVMFEAAAAGMQKRAAAWQLAASLVHAVVGRVVALVILEGRAWDTGLENLWVHVDPDGAIDWVAVVDPTLRVLPDDSCLRPDGASRQAAVVRLPSELALTTWVAHRCHRTLVPLFSRLRAVSHDAIREATMWQIVGSAIVAVATRIPHLAGADELTGMRRSQAILDAMVGFGLPVRGPSRHAHTKASLGLAELGQPCLR
ncbi:iron reductase [Mycobacterium sp.]|uniref:iron reductase n=1 Tax=Mycobacterium sp. TaxID=1785 RepID=UPI003C7439A7